MNKKKPFFLRAWTIIIGTFTFLSILLSLVTGGFQVWDIFKINKTVKVNPIIDIRIDPVEFNYYDLGNYQIGLTTFTIQTSNGSYQLLESIKVDTLVIIKPEYFYDSIKKPNTILTEVTLDNMILDNRIPEEIGLLKFENDFILRGDKITELMISKQKETIGIIIVRFPYIFENEKYNLIKRIPINVFYEENKL